MASEADLRFLLDQDFPKPKWNVHQLDHTVTYEHVADWQPELVETSTPDWMLQLAAAEGGFTGIVTGDYHSVAQDEEVVALERTDLTIVTWRKGIDNPVVQWGSLLAYMPQIKKAIAQHGASIITSPVPTQIDREPTKGLSRRHAKSRDSTIHELRKNVLPEMIDELKHRDRADLADRLKPQKGGAP